MDEQTAPTTEATPEAQVADILRELGVEPEATTPDGQPTPTASDDDDDDDNDDGDDSADEDDDDDGDAEDPDTDEDDDDEEDDPDLELDPELAKHPALLKRWKEQRAGLEKLVARYQAQTQENSQLIEFGRALEDPAQAVAAYRHLGQQLAVFHGFDPAELGVSTDTPRVAESIESDVSRWEEMGFDSPGEYRAFLMGREETRAMIEALKAEIQPTRAEAERLRQEREASERERAFRARIEEIAPKVQERIQRVDSGWTVTPEMIAQAIQALPQFADKPTKAVQMYYSTERAKHIAKVASKRAGVPDMTGRGTAQTGTAKPPHLMTGSEVIAALGFNE